MLRAFGLAATGGVLGPEALQLVVRRSIYVAGPELRPLPIRYH